MTSPDIRISKEWIPEDQLKKDLSLVDATQMHKILHRERTLGVQKLHYKGEFS